MKILQLCGKVPFPTRDGGCLAMEALSRDLHQIGQLVAVGAFSTHKHPFDAESIAKHPVYGKALKSIPLDIRLKPVNALSSLIRKKIPYNLERFYTKEGIAFVQDLVKKHQPDLIVLDGVQLLPYFQLLKESGARIVYRSHNCEYRLWEGRAAHCKDPVKKIYLNFLSRQMKQYEQSILSKMDGLLWISDRDRKEMNLPALYGKQMIYPFTIQLPPAEKNQARDKQAPVFFHIGSMDWEPNIEGINWFLQKVWSRVNLKSAALTFRIAGKNMPDKLQQLQLKGFENVGEVKDAQAFMREGDVMVVPLFSGSGIRVKIVEAMAMGKTVLTTQKGVEGIEGTPGVHWFSADGQDSFLERIHFIVEHTEEREKVGAAGRELVEKLFSANKFFPQIKDFILQAPAHE